MFSVDIRNAGPALKFSKCVTVREFQLVDEYAIILKHFTSSKFYFLFYFCFCFVFFDMPTILY